MNYPRTMLIEYVKERYHGRLQKVGTFVGINENGVIKTGFSRCHLGLDKFNKEQGVAFACQDILNPKPVPVGRDFSKKYAIFRNRCNRYFKDAAFRPSSNFENRPYPSELNNLWNEMVNNYLFEKILKMDVKANQEPPMQNRVLGIKASKCMGCQLEQACFPKTAAKKSFAKDIVQQEKKPVALGNVETDKHGTPLPTPKK